MAYDKGVVESLIEQNQRLYKSLGHAIILRHDHIKNADGVSLRSVYLHLNAPPATLDKNNKIKKLSVNDDVERWDTIGEAGSTGTGSGVHLHFELRFFKGNPDPKGDDEEFLFPYWGNIYGGKKPKHDIDSEAFNANFRRNRVDPLNPPEFVSSNRQSWLPSPPVAARASLTTVVSSETITLRRAQSGQEDANSHQVARNYDKHPTGLSSSEGRVLLIPNENTTLTGGSLPEPSSSVQGSRPSTAHEDTLDVQKRLKKMLNEPVETRNPPNGKDDDHDGMIDEGYAHQTSFYIMDNGNISDDEFFITIGSHKSPTVPAGSILQWGINLSAGKHVLNIHCVKAPDNQGTYMIWGAGNATLNKSGVIGNGESEEIHFWVR